MAKGQKRSNREAKKPKQPKAERSASTPLAPAPGVGNASSVDIGRGRPGSRTGRR
jgi:hypothetical protein